MVLNKQFILSSNNALLVDLFSTYIQTMLVTARSNNNVWIMPKWNIQFHNSGVDGDSWLPTMLIYSSCFNPLKLQFTCAFEYSFFQVSDSCGGYASFTG